MSAHVLIGMHTHRPEPAEAGAYRYETLGTLETPATAEAEELLVQVPGSRHVFRRVFRRLYWHAQVLQLPESGQWSSRKRSVWSDAFSGTHTRMRTCTHTHACMRVHACTHTCTQGCSRTTASLARRKSLGAHPCVHVYNLFFYGRRAVYTNIEHV